MGTMLTCRQVRAVLVDYQDGSLPEAGREAVEAHLGACRECRWQLAALNRVDLDLRRALKPVEVPAGFTEQVMGRLRSQPAPERVGWAAPWAAVAAAAAALVLALGIMAGLRAREGRPGAARNAAVALAVEPAGPDRPVGAAFVITPGGRKPYEGVISVEIRHGRGGAPELTVDAFPLRGSGT